MELICDGEKGAFKEFKEFSRIYEKNVKKNFEISFQVGAFKKFKRLELFAKSLKIRAFKKLIF